MVRSESRIRGELEESDKFPETFPGTFPETFPGTHRLVGESDKGVRTKGPKPIARTKGYELGIIII